MLAKIKGYIARRKVYWLYVPLFWILLAVIALMILKKHAIVPFLYRTV
jgi:hypothetical protein